MGRFPGGAYIFALKISRLDLWATQPLILCTFGVGGGGLRLPGREVKYEWSYTSSPLWTELTLPPLSLSPVSVRMFFLVRPFTDGFCW